MIFFFDDFDKFSAKKICFSWKPTLRSFFWLKAVIKLKNRFRKNAKFRHVRNLVWPNLTERPIILSLKTTPSTWLV
jgi:hypothetical protein